MGGEVQDHTGMDGRGGPGPHRYGWEGRSRTTQVWMGVEVQDHTGMDGRGGPGPHRYGWEGRSRTTQVWTGGEVQDHTGKGRSRTTQVWIGGEVQDHTGMDGRGGPGPHRYGWEGRSRTTQVWMGGEVQDHTGMDRRGGPGPYIWTGGEVQDHTGMDGFQMHMSVSLFFCNRRSPHRAVTVAPTAKPFMADRLSPYRSEVSNNKLEDARLVRDHITQAVLSNSLEGEWDPHGRRHDPQMTVTSLAPFDNGQSPAEVDWDPESIANTTSLEKLGRSFDLQGYLRPQHMDKGDGDPMLNFNFNQVASDNTPPNRALKDLGNPR